ncbi:hypothetical protein LX16_3063 [Stackebrandtia albiflava]|uniref:Uncharacterized protein n=1 Tax=Stackebrandtia albiflava TaxID=406432 RepID=A0A562V3C5_9ACTN|nr:hypothetical protein [Stackebrandtia albiflava]TWJ12307.1 hypothetical protein LX16_3063 [Stackebrandtia albiflava]
MVEKRRLDDLGGYVFAVYVHLSQKFRRDDGERHSQESFEAVRRAGSEFEMESSSIIMANLSRMVGWVLYTFTVLVFNGLMFLGMWELEVSSAFRVPASVGLLQVLILGGFSVLISTSRYCATIVLGHKAFPEPVRIKSKGRRRLARLVEVPHSRFARALCVLAYFNMAIAFTLAMPFSISVT